MKMSRDQIKFGEEKLSELSKETKIPKEHLVLALYNIHKLARFYKWVNADLFINRKIHFGNEE